MEPADELRDKPDPLQIVLDEDVPQWSPPVGGGMTRHGRDPVRPHRPAAMEATAGQRTTHRPSPTARCPIRRNGARR